LPPAAAATSLGQLPSAPVTLNIQSDAACRPLVRLKGPSRGCPSFASIACTA
jgi:hypothetical protein